MPPLEAPFIFSTEREAVDPTKRLEEALDPFCTRPGISAVLVSKPSAAQKTGL